MIFNGFQDSLDIEMKLRVCQVADFSGQVQEIAGKAIASIKEENFSVESLKGIQIEDLLESNREHLQSWLSILLGKIGKTPSMVQALFRESFRQVGISEQNLFFFIDLIKTFLTLVPSDFLLDSLKTLIGECCKYEAQMQQEAVDTGIAFIQEYIQNKQDTARLLAVLDGYLADKSVHQ